MAVLMTGLSEKGVDLIWKQCDEEQFPKGIEYLEGAMRAGDPEALFFLGFCYSWGDGGVGFNDSKAYECYKEGARAGSFRCVPGALRTGRYDEGIREAAKYSAEESYREVLAAAEEGDAFAAWQIGAALEWEEPIALSLWPNLRRRDCFIWYEKAANGGIVSAMVKAGKCCMEGRFTDKNTEKGMVFANQAATLGNAWGLYHMGLYFQDTGNDEAAFDYFSAASSQGDKNAPYLLGQMYLMGKSVGKDINRAVDAFEMAADRDNKDCLTQLGDLFFRDEVVDRDNERAFFWYSRAYAVGDKAAALPLGHLHLSNWEKQDYQKAEKYFREAAGTEETGNAELQLGNIYRFGIGQEPDRKQAVLFYETGADKGNAECMEILGNLYFLGGEADEDHVRSFHWLDRCRREETLQSYSKLGFLYMKGHGCEADEERARELFEIAAETDCDGYANYELAYMYERRGQSAEDLDMAAVYYQHAIELGNDSAMRRFAHFKKTVFGKWKVVY